MAISYFTIFLLVVILIWFIYGLGIIVKLLTNDLDINLDWLNFPNDISNGLKALPIIIISIIAAVILIILSVIMTTIFIIIAIISIIIGSLISPVIIILIDAFKNKE